MKIIHMSGGLANQMLMYSFFRYNELVSGETCWLDDIWYECNDEHNGYELQSVFGLDPNRFRKILCQNVKDDLTAHIQHGTILHALRDAIPGLQICAEGYQSLLSIGTIGRPHAMKTVDYILPFNQYSRNAALFRGNVYYLGLWANYRWFYAIRDVLLEEFSFPDIVEGENLAIQRKIENTSSVGIHVRRGGARVNAPTYEVIDMKWYRMAIPHMRDEVRHPVFFLFTDDPDWCMRNYAEIGLTEKDEVNVVAGNFNGKNYIDMQLMSYCKNMVNANSSFSYMASLLNRNPNKYVLYPDSVFRV